MTNQQQLSALDIWDDKLEAQLLEIMEAKDTKLELERARVPDQVWQLEDQLMKERSK